MKFYNITYDLNSPVVQQVNIPTNTDYRVGMKFKRDGKILDVSPSEAAVGDYSIDDRRTNGYVTYTVKGGDRNSYTQYTVRLDHKDTVQVYVSYTRYVPSGSSASMEFPINVDYLTTTLGLDGWHLPVSGLKRGDYVIRRAQELTIDDIQSWESYTMSHPVFAYKPNADDKIVQTAVRAQNGYFQVRTNWNDPSATPTWADVDEYIIGDGFPKGLLWIRNSDGIVSGLCTFIAAVQLNLYKPVSGKFKLNENIFKSQAGDLEISREPPSQTTHSISGIRNGRTFSYDIFTK